MSNGLLEPQFPKGNTVSMTVKQNKHLSNLLRFLYYFDCEYYMTDTINEYYLKCLLFYILVGNEKKISVLAKLQLGSCIIHYLHVL